MNKVLIYITVIFISLVLTYLTVGLIERTPQFSNFFGWRMCGAGNYLIFPKAYPSPEGLVAQCLAVPISDNEKVRILMILGGIIFIPYFIGFFILSKSILKSNVK